MGFPPHPYCNLPRRFAQLSTTDHDEAVELPYAPKPKAELDALPLEILLEIACYLPDAHTAVRLSCVCRSLYLNLAGSQYFWYRFGNRNLVKFQRFKPRYDYHDYIVRVVMGKIKSTCQICLTPRKGAVREPLGMVVCGSCMDENVVIRGSVTKIPKLDWRAIPDISFTYDIRSAPGSRNPRALTRYCMWLPTVKKHVESAYGLPWKEVVKQHLENIRPLVSPKEIRNYRHSVNNKVYDAAIEIFRRDLESHLAPHVPNVLDNFKRFLDAQRIDVWYQIVDLGVPTDGQIDRADKIWLSAQAAEYIANIMGPQIDENRPHVRYYLRTPIWPSLSTGLINRLTLGGQTVNKCDTCEDAKTLVVTSGFGRRRPPPVYYSPRMFLEHVQDNHPDRLLAMNWQWTL
ncbi:hypothetical protein H072_3524 [Dactylellina haptotyla CBS 200.50]|uniref:F-box domain-containing protein n=1 Tax=Dactylellina haptotyla (strain CBS 200.50) TaxID=1284197 RepID=S8BSS0_DACHA|nr:hypothetical protein H072_3524 [Dactylellina haptotyla CBS 200.50]